MRVSSISVSGHAGASMANRDFMIARTFDADGATIGYPRSTTHRRRSVLPGFGLSLGFAIVYLSRVVLIPLSAAFLKTAQLTWPAFLAIVTAPRVVASYRLTFGASFGAAMINTVFGLLVAWVLVRYRFPGRRLVDCLVALPFALPTAVAGIALAGLFSTNGWFGSLLVPLGVKVAFT